ncbi:TIGR03085 family metal-binding protein [Pseudonocardia lacus]|uniref:TIGR03085 family metal-binding protein n=1 Tax=Pseudonocardia lacus TaxID=2835865 RepID=UPI001BDC874D|nr:TIGR03085 family metal-binding protein [Pseudonocardia lacus]
MNLAADERAAICAEFERSGPDKPTLCAGWNTHDLLAHLLVRERQPWTAPGLLVPALGPVVDKAMRGYADTPWPEMIDQLRHGPPAWSPFRIGKVDEMANGAEFFVHHEDVRRGEPGWEPRPPDAARDDHIWDVLGRTGKLAFRRSPSGIVLRRPSGEQQVVSTGRGVVTIVGEPGELLLVAFGRSAARVQWEGDPATVESVVASDRGI